MKSILQISDNYNLIITIIVVLFVYACIYAKILGLNFKEYIDNNWYSLKKNVFILPFSGFLGKGKGKNIFSKTIYNKKTKIEFTFKSKNLNFKGTLVYTGLKTGTGGRIKKAYNQLGLNEDIMMTYGDGLGNISIKKLVKFHYKNNSKVTLTAVRPKQRYGILKIKNNKITYFDNENKNAETYINGGFFIIDKSAIKQINKSSTYWEQEPLNFFAKKKQLYAFKHEGFWKSLDTLKDKNDFNLLYKNKKKLPWKI